MAKNETAAATTTSPKQFVIWKHANNFEERVLTAQDFKNLGAETASAVTWNAANDFRVERSEVPLNDEQLADLMSRDRMLVLETEV